MAGERKAVIEAAIQLFGERGSDSVSIRQLSRKTGVPVDTVNRMFGSKEHLLEQALESVSQANNQYAPTEEEVREILRTGTVEDALLPFVVYYDGEENRRILSVYRMLYIEQFRNRSALDTIHRMFVRQPIGAIRRTLDILVKLEAIPPCDSGALAELWTRTYLIYGLQAIHDPSNMDYQEYAAMGRFFIRMAAEGVPPLPVEALEIRWDSPSRPLEEADPGTERRIYLRALELFVEQGYGQVTLRQIGEAAGLEGPAIYRYYGSKSEMMQRIVDELMDGYRRYRLDNPALVNILDSKDHSRIVLSLSRIHPPFTQGLVYKLYRILFREQFLNEDLKDFLLSTIYKDIEAVTCTLEELADQGRIPRRESRLFATAYIHTLCSMAAEETADSPGREGMEERRRRSVALLVSYAVNGLGGEGRK